MDLFRIAAHGCYFTMVLPHQDGAGAPTGAVFTFPQEGIAHSNDRSLFSPASSLFFEFEQPIGPKPNPTPKPKTRMSARSLFMHSPSSIEKINSVPQNDTEAAYIIVLQ